MASAEGEPIHNLPVDLSALGVSDVGYVCATQPRQYCADDGSCSFSTDYYVQLSACPDVPMD